MSAATRAASSSSSKWPRNCKTPPTFARPIHLCSLMCQETNLCLEVRRMFLNRFKLSVPSSRKFKTPTKPFSRANPSTAAAANAAVSNKPTDRRNSALNLPSTSVTPTYFMTLMTLFLLSCAFFPRPSRYLSGRPSFFGTVDTTLGPRPTRLYGAETLEGGRRGPRGNFGPCGAFAKSGRTTATHSRSMSSASSSSQRGSSAESGTSSSSAGHARLGALRREDGGAPGPPCALRAPRSGTAAHARLGRTF
mmetsp:Transcript_24637/g.82883  ORF Transcript_24637/g.82883 Transcript_24637/m.82883 type:complete len:250 (+) Transcript_24637:239-988(+)